MKYLQDTAIESNAPFIALTETHLKPEILDPEVKIDGWSLYRTDRGPGKSHGGVAIYLRNDLIGQLVTSHSNSICETLVVKVKTLNLILVCVYRPPNSTVEAFEEALNVCQKAINDVTDSDPKVKDILMLGDFNLPFISWPKGEIYQKEVAKKSGEKQQAVKLVNFVERNFLENYVNTATRGNNILDLVFTNNHLLVNSYITTVNKKMSDHYLLTIALNFTYNAETKKKKVTNPYSTKVYEYNLNEASENDWKRFNAILESVSKDFEVETRNENAEVKLAKVYEYVERATHVVFMKKKIFEDETEKEEIKVTRNKIPKRIRALMKKKKKLSSQILSSSSWRKNYKTMVELEEVETEIDEEYKKRRLKEEKKAIGAIKRNPKYFYTYAKTFAKSKSEMAAFEKENGELTDDPFEKSEILRKQYESVASVPRKEFEVKEDFFINDTEEQTDDNENVTPLVDICDSPPFVSECIDMLAAGAAPGPDGIPAAMIKGAKSAFSSPIPRNLFFICLIRTNKRRMTNAEIKECLAK